MKNLSKIRLAHLTTCMDEVIGDHRFGFLC